jgi:hypothetical protein
MPAEVVVARAAGRPAEFEWLDPVLVHATIAAASAAPSAKRQRAPEPCLRIVNR